MSKEKFLIQLQNGLAGLPQEDINERLTFYREMIDDRIEEGLTEDEAVAEIGPVQAVVKQIHADTPLSKLVKERVKPKRTLKTFEILLLVLGAPLWFALLITLFSLLFAFYVVVWSLAIAFWSVMAALFFSSSSMTSSARGSFASWNFFLMFSLTASGFSRTNLMSSMVFSPLFEMFLIL